MKNNKNLKKAIKHIKESNSFIMAWEGGVCIEGNLIDLICLFSFVVNRLKEDGSIDPETIKEAVNNGLMSYKELRTKALRIIKEKSNK